MNFEVTEIDGSFGIHCILDDTWTPVCKDNQALANSIAQDLNENDADPCHVKDYIIDVLYEKYMLPVL